MGLCDNLLPGPNAAASRGLSGLEFLFTFTADASLADHGHCLITGHWDTGSASPHCFHTVSSSHGPSGLHVCPQSWVVCTLLVFSGPGVFPPSGLPHGMLQREGDKDHFKRLFFYSIQSGFEMDCLSEDKGNPTLEMSST